VQEQFHEAPLVCQFTSVGSVRGGDNDKWLHDEFFKSLNAGSGGELRPGKPQARHFFLRLSTAHSRAHSTASAVVHGCGIQCGVCSGVVGLPRRPQQCCCGREEHLHHQRHAVGTCVMDASW
jgi:hypothetical protein